jgi:phosphoribosylformylglycinamidine synthase subunit PurQ / glutaminase
MPKVRSIVVSGNGVNCENEMAHANRMAGADEVDIVSIYELLAGEASLDSYQLLNFPGGFLDGDDMGSAKAAANRYQYARVAGKDERLSDQLMRFIQAGKCIIGVCNGFQLLVKLGLLPAVGGKYFVQQATLTNNDSGRFENRWVRLLADEKSPCVFTKNLTRMELPIRHGEGKFVVPSKEFLARMNEKHLVPLRYADESFTVTERFPQNPNGSPQGIAGVCDESGRVFGLMPHPEAFQHRTNHPRWTREEMPEEGQGLAIFRNAIEYLKQA